MEAEMIAHNTDGISMSKAELLRHERKAFEGCVDFVMCMPDGQRERWLDKVVGLEYGEMEYVEVMAALTLARATAIRIAAEVAAV